MKAVIKNGMLVDEQGFELYPNRVYMYGSGFRNIIENHPEGTEVEIKNCWNSSTLYSDNARILYGSCLDFSFAEPTEPVEKTTEQTINTSNLFEEGCDDNDDSRDISNADECSVSSSSISSSVQNEHGTVSEDAGNN